MSNGWPYSQGKSMGSIPPENPMLIYREDLMESSPCAPASIVHSQNLAFCDINEQNSAGSFDANGMVDKDVWTLTNPISRGNIGLPPPSSSSVLHQTLSQIPTDFGFIEQAARFSCFSTGTLSNSLSIPSSMNQQYTRGVTTMLGPGGVSSGGRLNLFSEGLSQENETNVIEGSRDDSMSIERGTNQESPNGRRKTESFIRSRNQANEGQFDPGYESIQAEFSRGSDQAEPSEGTCQGTSSKVNALKKRKQIILDNELDQVQIAADPTEALKHHSENQKKGNQNPASTANKPSEKHGKLGQQAPDSLKQEYTHVRARRGQATSSHSLAERVRREKISERMKYLQDLVPGCSKVTGKAVMLDEIINYVQSLQQQVEFLSMKLASVDPRMDYDIEGITRKDILQSQAGPSSGLGFHSEMPMPYLPLHLPQPGPVQAACHGTGTSSDALRRTISSHMTAMRGGNKDLTSQPPVPDTWEDELHNIVHTGLNPNAPLNIEDLNDKTFPLSPN